MALINDWSHQMPSIDKPFYKELGQRIATHRKSLGMSQAQLAEELGISQKTMGHYEVGRLRISVELLALLAKTLSVSVEELIDGSATKAKAKRGPASLLQRQIEQVESLPRTKQKFVSEMLETVILQAQS
jgi:transcriptional regulator with XRE-family HTH domain